MSYKTGRNPKQLSDKLAIIPKLYLHRIFFFIPYFSEMSECFIRSSLLNYHLKYYPQSNKKSTRNRKLKIHTLRIKNLFGMFALLFSLNKLSCFQRNKNKVQTASKHWKVRKHLMHIIFITEKTLRETGV